MDIKYNNISIPTLNLILKKLNDKKVIRNPNKQILTVDKIISANTRICRYVGDVNNAELKTHLHIKFTSFDESGTICLSVLLNSYIELFV